MRTINPRTGKKEKHWQCPACFDFIPSSEYSEHLNTCEAVKAVHAMGRSIID